MEILDTTADLAWLEEVHLPGVDCTAFAQAVIHGNEDCPAAVDLYHDDNFNSRPVRYAADEHGNLQREE